MGESKLCVARGRLFISSAMASSSSWLNTDRSVPFGLAWMLVNLVETAPNWPVGGALDGLEGEWIDRLRERAE